MIFKKFICPTYGAQVWYITNCTHLECKTTLEKRLNATIDDWDNEKAKGFTEQYEDPDVFVVWTEKKKDLETLIHELVHLADFILKDRGVNTNDSELTAYYVSFLFKIFTEGKYSK